MSFFSAAKSIGLSKSFERLALGASSFAAKMTGPIVQVRTATKKVSGSRTNMRDSAGRRLGAKAAENEPVKPGQILMRQRGTKFYPGENAGIGKDHTIFALEPGYVRFYLDPFHPKRKFIGVALRPELRLPTDHFAPRVRRLGYVPIEDDAKAAFEENNLKRKDHLQRPTILQDLKKREEARLELLERYTEQLSKIAPSLSEPELKIAAQRFLSIRNLLKSGTSLTEAQSTTTLIYQQNLKLQKKKLLIEESDFERLEKEYKILAEKVDTTVSFNSKYGLISFITEEDRINNVQEVQNQLNTLFNESQGQETVRQMKQILEENSLLNHKEVKYFTEKYILKLESKLKSAKSKSKGAPVFKRWNYEKNKVESIISA